MSAIVVMRELLLAYGPVAALVASRVHAGVVPDGTELPAIGLREVSRIERPTVALSEATEIVIARIQVTVHGKSYPEQKALILATKLGAGPHTGIIKGIDVRSVVRDIVGPDMSDDDAGIYEQSRDFKVTYIEPR